MSGRDGGGNIRPRLQFFHTDGNFVTGGESGSFSILGEIDFHADNNPTVAPVWTGQPSATIMVNATASPGAGEIAPAKISFATTPIAASSPSNRLVIFETGNIGIGPNAVLTAAATLHVDGDIRFEDLTGGGANLIVDGSGNVTVSSDERLKDIKGNYTRGLNSIMQLEPITYQWNELSGMETQGFYTGFSAQNVQKSIPEAVGTDSRGYLTLADRPIIASLVNAVKEQQAEIETLKNEINRMNTDVGDRLAMIEKSMDKLSRKQERRLTKK